MFGQEVYMNIKEANENPNMVVSLNLNCEEDNCLNTLKNISVFSNLKELKLTSFSGKKVLNISSIQNLEKLTIENSPSINLKDLFKQLENNFNFKELAFNNNQLNDIPKSIKKITTLKTLRIENNPNLELDKIINNIKEVDFLRHLYLGNNGINSMPAQIQDLTNLVTLDLKGNVLTSIGDELNGLLNLENLMLEGNVFEDFFGDINSVELPNLLSLVIDEELSKEEMEKLKNKFEGAKIINLSANPLDNEILPEDTLIDEKVIPDSLVEKEDKVFTYGELTIEKDKVKIFSQAYLHYPKIFKLNMFSEMDKLLFEERFLDTTYANVNKIQYNRDRKIYKRTYENIRLEKFKGDKNEIWFNFKRDQGYGTYLLKNNPEMNAFMGMQWVYVGNLSKKEFKQSFFKLKPEKWYKFGKYKHWTDFRITYNNEEQLFTMILKDLEGFKEIKAYPKFSSRGIEEAQKTYVSRYSNYVRSLDTRKKRFEKSMLRDKSIQHKAVKKNDEKKWDSFQKHFMSEKERELTREEWLAYYDEVIANEKKAMGNASASVENIERSLIMDNYEEGFYVLNNRNRTQETDSIESLTIRALFQDSDSNMLAIKNVLIIEPETKRYRKIKGSLGIEVIRMYLESHQNYILLAQVRNDDVGYVSLDEFRNIKFSKNRSHKFTLSKVSSKIATVGMIRKQLTFYVTS